MWCDCLVPCDQLFPVLTPPAHLATSLPPPPLLLTCRHLLKKKSRKIAPRMRTAEDVLAACKNRSVVVLPAFERLEHEGVTLEEAIERSMEVTKGE